MPSLLPGVVADQVDRHVVGGAEGRTQLVRSRGGQPRHAFERHLLLVQDHRVPDLVDPPPPRSPGELRVLAGCEQLVPLARELPQVLDHHGFRRHVDAEGEGLGGEHHLDQPLLEQPLHRLLEHRQHPRVMRGDPRGQGLPQLEVAEGGELFLLDPRHLRVGELEDPVALRVGGQPDPRLHEVAHARVAARAAEHEVDGGEHALLVEDPHHLFPPRDVDASVPFAGPLDPGHQASAVPGTRPGPPLPGPELLL